jgi:hypothetical protein
VPKTIVALIAVYVLGALAFFAACVYVAAHFIVKFW